MAVEGQAVHAGRCPTAQLSRPLARMRSPRLLTAAGRWSTWGRQPSEVQGAPILLQTDEVISMTSRRIFLATVTGGLLLPPLDAAAQQAGKVYRIGFLWDTPAVWPHALEAFRQGLRDLGWVEGRNIVIEYRCTEGRFDRLPSLVERSSDSRSISSSLRRRSTPERPSERPRRFPSSSRATRTRSAAVM